MTSTQSGMRQHEINGTTWQWAIITQTDSGVMAAVAYKADGGWQHVCATRFDSVEEFNRHVTAFVEMAHSQAGVGA